MRELEMGPGNQESTLFKAAQGKAKSPPKPSYMLEDNVSQYNLRPREGSYVASQTSTPRRSMSHS